MALVILVCSLITLLLASIVTLASHIITARSNRKRAVGFFHPYTNDGGGGERVLWCAVKAIQEETPDLDCVVYTGDHDASPHSLTSRAIDRFGVHLLHPPKVVHLNKRKWIEESAYPRFTMIGQSFGSVFLSWEALCKFTPLYYFDTCGYAFTYPLARLFGCIVVCYTHYPTISLDMISRVRGRSSMYNNNALIAQRMHTGTPSTDRWRLLVSFGASLWFILVLFICHVYYELLKKTFGFLVSLNLATFFGLFFPLVVPDKVVSPGSIWLSRSKVIYYTLFSWMYGFVGSCAHLAMVNSSWTQSHIENLWRISDRIKRVYPPCDTSGLQALPLERSTERPAIISVAQFRPEKAHPLQLEAFSVAMKKLDEDLPRPKLQFVGSCRNKSDDERLQNLKDKAVELKVDGDVEFHKNLMYKDLVELLGGAVAGIHSMTDEHFGISVVEYMAAGAIPIAHNSAGPKMDIVLEEDSQQTGFLAQNAEQYADAILKIIRMPATERLKMAAAARRRAGRFSEQRFYEDFKAAIRPVLKHATK